jgi:Tfp pilus assembly protein PilE
MIVVAIIGILAAIAIPQFASYRQRGFDARANSDLRNAATSEEAYFATWQLYVGCTNCASTDLPGFQPSATCKTSMVKLTGTEPGFTGTSKSDSGSGTVFNYDSTKGGMQANS